jgi:hypothetical protein
MFASFRRRFVTRLAAPLATVLGLSVTGCQARGAALYPGEIPEDSPDGTSDEATAGHPAPLALPLQRDIPLRIVVPNHCEGCRACAQSCTEPPQRDILESVARANEVFAPAGIRFVFQGVERVEAPTFWKQGVRDRKMTWAEIRDDLRRIHPSIPPNAWRDPDEVKTSERWLEVATAVYGRPDAITIFAQHGGGNRGETSFPNGGRAIFVQHGLFGHGPGRGRSERRDALYLFAHELGHYFGLRHTFAHAGTNPVNGAPWRLADRWDLVYHPGSSPRDPHVFFNSRAEAARYPDAELRLIETMVDKQSNCVEERDGAISCELEGANGYAETHRSGDPALKGLSFPLGGRGRYRWARNALAYGDMEIPRRLSPSQLEIIRIFLLHPIEVGPQALRRWGRLPDGVRAIRARRTTLGLSHDE